MVKGLRILEDPLEDPQVAALLTLHMADMRRNSPPGSVHALPIDSLRAADVTFYAAWDGPVLAGCGALRELSSDHGEIKSMRAAPAYRDRGVGRAILDHLLAQANARGYDRMSLETGRGDAFLPAQRLYLANGFVECGPFGSYRLDSFSMYMTRKIGDIS